MKRAKRFFGLLTCFTILLNLSCQSEEECYSCSESVDTWAHENLQIIKGMSRMDIIELPASKQRAAFRVLSPKQRQSVIISKLNHVYDFVKTNDEKVFINKVKEIAYQTDFSREWSDEEMLANESMLLEASKKLNWSKEFVVYAFGTLQNMDASKDNSKDFFRKEFQNPDKDCNCNWGWCPDDSDCEESSCDETTTGCSFLLLGPCDEICNPLDLGQ